MSEKMPRFVVAQLGARMHYAVPRIMAAKRLLERLYTDICGNIGWPQLLSLISFVNRNSFVRRIIDRETTNIPRDAITDFPLLGIQYAWRRWHATSPSDNTAAHLWAGRRFADLVVKRGFGHAGAVYTMNSAGLEILQDARAHGLFTVMEQTIAARAVERQLLGEEASFFPNWESNACQDLYADDYCSREQAEWCASDRIICGSDFVKDSIAMLKGPVDRCRVVPYGIQSDDIHAPDRAARTGPLRVLTVGALGLRKGTPYILEAAKRLQGKAHFRLVGLADLHPDALSDLSRWCEVTGPVVRSDIGRHYEWADLFLLPSICEGSATATYEALAWGLPVICTPNTGSVVRNGIEGYIVPVRNPSAIVAALEILADPARRAIASSAARDRAKEHDLSSYSRRLLEALQK